MKIIKNHCLWLVYFSMMVCGSVAAHAAVSCEMVYKDANEVLLSIEKGLEKITTKQQYEQSVKQRFEKVEKLLLASESCEKPKVMGDEFLQNWQQMYMTLTALQASAQLSAFSEFNNWLESKEKDLTAFEYAHSAQWKW